MDRLLPEVSASLAAFAERKLRERGVEVVLRRKLLAATGTEAVLDDGSRIPTRTLVATVPSFTHPLLEKLPLPKAKNGRLQVDAMMRVQDTTNVWAAGDCAVVPTPGGGFAPPTAQHAVRELANLLEDRGVSVKFGIHPVAGRMPGHMNVLLAEANVPYSLLYEMDQINPDLPQTDVAVVIGANDVVNPDARDNPKSPIAGMPIIEVDRAKSVVVLKRGKGKGFSGLENPLFFKPVTGMLYGDAKSSITGLTQAVQEV